MTLPKSHLGFSLIHLHIGRYGEDACHEGATCAHRISGSGRDSISCKADILFAAELPHKADKPLSVVVVEDSQSRHEQETEYDRRQQAASSSAVLSLAAVIIT